MQEYNKNLVLSLVGVILSKENNNLWQNIILTRLINNNGEEELNRWLSDNSKQLIYDKSKNLLYIEDLIVHQ